MSRQTRLMFSVIDVAKVITVTITENETKNSMLDTPPRCLLVTTEPLNYRRQTRDDTEGDRRHDDRQKEIPNRNKSVADAVLPNCRPLAILLDAPT